MSVYAPRRGIQRGKHPHGLGCGLGLGLGLEQMLAGLRDFKECRAAMETVMRARTSL